MNDTHTLPPPGKTRQLAVVPGLPDPLARRLMKRPLRNPGGPVRDIAAIAHARRLIEQHQAEIDERTIWVRNLRAWIERTPHNRQRSKVEPSSDEGNR